MSSSKKGTPTSRASPAVSFVLPDLPLTPASLLSNASSRRQTARSTIVRAVRDRNATPHSTKHDNINSDNNMCTPKTADGPSSENSMILLPPSQTINDSLSALAISTSKQLEEVWDELGFSPEERADQLTDLLSSFRQLCEEKIESERLVASNYRQMIVEYKEEIRATSLALKVDVDESLLKEDSGQTLQDEAITLEIKLEDLRSIADVARNELSKYKQELIDNHRALGLSLEENWMDVSSDLTRDRVLEFRDKAKEVDAAVSHRASAVVQLLQDCQELIKTLRYDTEDNELDQKIMKSLVPDTEDGSVMKIASKFESETCTGISASALDSLTQRLSDLHIEKKRRKATLNDMGALIGELWEKLHVPKDEQKKFADSINGLGMDTIFKGEQELARLRELKSAMMGKLILEAREKIKSLWNETNATEAQRESFGGMLVENESDFNDNLLTEHEEYIEILVTRLEQMRPLLEQIRKRESILAERKQYEEFLKDPDRLKQRGAALTKQLMKEEKMSRRIKKDLPKYTERLEKKLKDWEIQNDEAFLFNGEVYLDVMKRQEEEWIKYKDDQMKEKLEKKQKQRITDKSGSGYHHIKKAPIVNAPLADKTNRSRPVSRLRPISRGRKREDANKPQLVSKEDGRKNTASRGRGNFSRGRAAAPSRSYVRPGAH